MKDEDFYKMLAEINGDLGRIDAHLSSIDDHIKIINDEHGKTLTRLTNIEKWINNFNSSWNTLKKIGAISGVVITIVFAVLSFLAHIGVYL